MWSLGLVGKIGRILISRARPGSFMLLSFKSLLGQRMICAARTIRISRTSRASTIIVNFIIKISIKEKIFKLKAQKLIGKRFLLKFHKKKKINLLVSHFK